MFAGYTSNKEQQKKSHRWVQRRQLKKALNTSLFVIFFRKKTSHKIAIIIWIYAFATFFLL